MIFTDLDGTLLDDESKVSPKNYQTLLNLQKTDIPVVAATGRSIYSTKLVLADDFPIDYLAFSNGAGVMNWKTKEILMENHLTAKQMEKIANLLISLDIDFSMHDTIPNNHHFAYWQSKNTNGDFLQRVTRFAGYGREFDLKNGFKSGNTVLAIIENSPELFEKVEKNLPDLEVIRTTSPIDNSSIWIEIFPVGVSKGSAGKWLCSYLNYPESKCTSIGNDYNDVHMLDWTDLSFVVDNAPSELKERYPVVAANTADGFSCAVEAYLKHYKIKI